MALRKSFLAPLLTSNSLKAANTAVANYLADIAPAYSPHTLRGLRSDWRAYSAWCRREGVKPLPAAPATVTAYMAMLSSARCPGTVRHHLVTLSHLHRAFGLANPIESPVVRLAWRMLTRRRAVRPASQRAPLRGHHVGKVLKVLGDSLIDRRDRAVLLTARDTLARRSELARMAVGDIVWNSETSGGQVLIRRAKNDPDGEGRLAWLCPATMVALRDYLDASSLDEGPLFRRILGGQRLGEALQARAIARRFKALAERAGLDAARVSAHSTRIGMALDLVADGQSISAIQLAGGWRSPAMPAYCARQLLPELGAVARYYETRSG